MRRRIRNLLKRSFLTLFKVMERLGLHVTPVHYYSPLPDTSHLARTRHEWARASEMPGVPSDPDAQAERLARVCRPYRHEYAGNAHYLAGMSRSCGPGYGYIEAQALHAVIRHLKPGRIVEVGSGVSTYCMLQARELNRLEGADSAIICIEPHPSEQLMGTPGVELRRQPVQTVPVAHFEKLAAGDFLFIDSSHAVRAGSDVNFLILEVLPRLRAGVWVHFHDIYLPYDYERSLLKTFLFSSETTLLRAFLTHNPRVRIVFCLSQLHYERRDALRELFPEYDPEPDEHGLLTGDRTPFEDEARHFPSSIYLQILD